MFDVQKYKILMMYYLENRYAQFSSNNYKKEKKNYFKY